MLTFRAYVFIGLNGVRVLSIISLILVFASNILTLVNDIKAVNAFVAGGSNSTSVTTHNQSYDSQYVPNSTIPNEPAGAAWGVLNRLLIIFQVVVLVMSEVGWPAVFFDKYFPILGKDFGVGALGLIQCLLGAAILSHHVDEFTLFSAFFLFSIGCLNILVGLIWREKVKSRRSITAWKERAKDVLPTRALNIAEKGMEFGRNHVFSHHTGASDETDGGASRSGSVSSTDKSGYGFGRQGEKAANLKGFILSRPTETLPKYAPGRNGGSRASSPVFSNSATVVETQ